MWWDVLAFSFVFSHTEFIGAFKCMNDFKEQSPVFVSMLERYAMLDDEPGFKLGGTLGFLLKYPPRY